MKIKSYLIPLFIIFGVFSIIVGSAYFLLFSQDAASGKKKNDISASLTANANTITLTWPPITDAIRYQLVILKDAEHEPKNFIFSDSGIYTNGYYLNCKKYNTQSARWWTVRALDYNGNPISNFLPPRPLSSGYIDSPSVAITAELSKMKESPLYPSYSWVPRDDATSYEIGIWKKGTPAEKNSGKMSGSKEKNKNQKPQTLESGDKCVANYETPEIFYLDMRPYTEPGVYYWRVRPKLFGKETAGEWSEPQMFNVSDKVTIAAFGDSITHGGSISNPPCFFLYSFTNHTPLTVKNLGHPGDTTGALVERFFHDVIPFSPRLLVIMGGINDIRLGFSSSEVIRHLGEIKSACLANGIIPVFLTVTPINPGFMKRFKDIEPIAPGWKETLAIVNNWIKQQEYHIDISSELTSPEGTLRADRSVDGLHPCAAAKKIIGEKIGSYLMKTFPEITMTGKPSRQR